MLASYAKWYSFTPPQRPNFPPPLTTPRNLNPRITPELKNIRTHVDLPLLRGNHPTVSNMAPRFQRHRDKAHSRHNIRDLFL